MSSTTSASPASTLKLSSSKPRRRGKKSDDPSKPSSLSVPDTAGTSTGPASPIDASVNGEFSKGENEVLKEIAKRLKRSTKKLESIEKSEAKIKNLMEAEKATTKLIVAEEREKINKKPITLAVHKELQEVYDKVKEQTEAEEKDTESHLAKQKQDHAEKLDLAVQQAKEEGRQEGLKEGSNEALTLLKFLRLAGFRRAVKGDDPIEEAAIEQVLILVYAGDSAISTCKKLAEGSPECIDENHPVTFGRIKELAWDLKTDDDCEVEDDASPQETQHIEVTSEGLPSEPEPIVQITQPEETTVTQPPPQALVNGDSSEDSQVPHVASTDHDGSDDAGQLDPVSQPPTITSDTVIAASDVWDEPASASADQSWDTPTMPTQDTSGDVTGGTSLKEEGFQNVEHKRGRGGRGRGGRGEGNYRGRGRGGFRGDREGGFRGGRDGGHRDGGEHRGRGGYRRPRGDGGFRSNKGGDHQQQTSPVS